MGWGAGWPCSAVGWWWLCFGVVLRNPPCPPAGPGEPRRGPGNGPLRPHGATLAASGFRRHLRPPAGLVASAGWGLSLWCPFRALFCLFWLCFFALCPSAYLFLSLSFLLCLSLTVCFGPCCSPASCCFPGRTQRQGSSAALLPRCFAVDVRCCFVFMLFSSPRCHLQPTCAAGPRRAAHTGSGSRDTA